MPALNVPARARRVRRIPRPDGSAYVLPAIAHDDRNSPWAKLGWRLRPVLPVARSRWIFAALFCAAFLIRLPNFGNPAYEVDEEFYLLVGDRLLHGMLPYVDIWDRKPIGLFLIYAAIRLLGGYGVLQYHIVATLFAGGTACLMHRLARPGAGNVGGFVAGLAYLVWIETAEGGGGQAPIFYNLFVAGTAGLALRAFSTTDRGDFRRLALLAMILGAFAIQIKYTAVFEVAYFGALLSWGTLRRTGKLASAAAETALIALVALSPTLLALGYYASIGEAQTFWFANFVSIFLRAPAASGELHDRFTQMILHILPFAVCCAAAFWHIRTDRRTETRRWQWIMMGWMLAALAGFFSVGALYFHYMLPLFVPFGVAAAPIFGRWPLGYVMAGLVLWLPFSHLNYPDFATSREFRTKTEAIAALIPSDVDQRCMQMFAGPPILYLRKNACFVSRYVFPDHLVSSIETHAIGVDAAAEINRIAQREPRALIVDEHAYHLDPVSSSALKNVLLRYYHRVGGVYLEYHRIDVWVSNR